MTDNKEIMRDDDVIKTDEGLIFNPYNSLNIKITLNEVQSILSRYNIPPIINNQSARHLKISNKKLLLLKDRPIVCR